VTHVGRAPGPCRHPARFRSDTKCGDAGRTVVVVGFGGRPSHVRCSQPSAGNGLPPDCFKGDYENGVVVDAVWLVNESAVGGLEKLPLPLFVLRWQACYEYTVFGGPRGGARYGIRDPLCGGRSSWAPRSESVRRPKIGRRRGPALLPKYADKWESRKCPVSTKGSPGRVCVAVLGDDVQCVANAPFGGVHAATTTSDRRRGDTYDGQFGQFGHPRPWLSGALSKKPRSMTCRVTRSPRHWSPLRPHRGRFAERKVLKLSA